MLGLAFHRGDVGRETRLVGGLGSGIDVGGQLGSYAGVRGERVGASRKKWDSYARADVLSARKSASIPVWWPQPPGHGNTSAMASQVLTKGMSAPTQRRPCEREGG